ncbi:MULTISPECIES: DUF3313 domain-containing protein [unclassified Bradyrhizobium]|uniref:DUF3313 domain-containing protein n=1 Tax=unclassified Bradyrhizobium TaxID=2631580 RepID=UPI0028E1AAC2|nr:MULTISPECIES: DUF3313 domain-containing protein [unclassified Bradyrhizobium]
MRDEDVERQSATAVGIGKASASVRNRACLVSFALALILCGCATAPMTQSGTLASYQELAPSNGVLAKSLLHVNKDSVLAAKTIRVSRAIFPQNAAPALSDEQRRLVANAVDRALCVDLSERFVVVAHGEPADLTTHAVITQATPTDRIAAGASKVVSVVPAALGVAAPVPVPRLPIGLGSLTIEAEALDHAGKQQAAMVWARGANSFTNSPTLSTAGDAYELAVAFGDDFGQMLVTGTTPFGKLPQLPSLDKIGSSLGGKPKYAACDAFGRDPGVIGLVANRLGAPPEWADKGAPADQQVTETASR